MRSILVRQLRLLIPCVLLAGCASSHQPPSPSLSPTDARNLAVAAVRQQEHNPALAVQAFDALPTEDGYTVYLQQRLTPTTARHWKVRVRSDCSAQVLPAGPPPVSPNTIEAYPPPLRAKPSPLH